MIESTSDIEQFQLIYKLLIGKQQKDNQKGQEQQIKQQRQILDQNDVNVDQQISLIFPPTDNMSDELIKQQALKLQVIWRQEFEQRMSYLKEEPQDQNYSSFDDILNKHDMKPLDIKKILGNSAKMLLVYDVYLKQIASQQGFKEKWEECKVVHRESINFLQSTFKKQKEKVDEYVPGQRERYLKLTLPMYKFTATKLSSQISQQKDAILPEESEQEENELQIIKQEEQSIQL